MQCFLAVDPQRALKFDRVGGVGGGGDVLVTHPTGAIKSQ